MPGLNVGDPDAMVHGEKNDEEIVFTSIRVTGVAAGLRRIPAGFYVAVNHSGHEWRTMNKPVSVENDVVEWGDPIPIPSDMSVTIRLAVYASFEFQPTLGHGELLHSLMITVDKLLDHSARELSFTFIPNDEDVLCPCSSLLAGVKRRKLESNDPSQSSVVDPHSSTTESIRWLEEATNLGHSALSCYRKDGDEHDLHRAIAHFEYALDICPQDHPCRAAVQSNLAMAMFIGWRVDGTGPFQTLETPITLFHNALAARQAGHPDRHSTLIHLAVVLLARFERLRHNVDAVHAEAYLHEVISFSAADSHDKRAATFVYLLYSSRKTTPCHEIGRHSGEQNSTLALTDEDPLVLSSRLLWRFDRFGDLAELQLAISLLETSLQSGHRDAEPLTLTSLGGALIHRFRCLGQLGDLEQAISRYGDALAFTPDGHPDKPSRLNNLAQSFLMRFERFGEPNDLERAISSGRNAVELALDGHPSKPSCLNILALCCKARYERFGESSDLEQAISRQRLTIELTPNGHLDKPNYLNNLANSLVTRFDCLGELNDLEQAISMYGDVLEFTPDGHPNKSNRLNNLANALVSRFERLGMLGDIEKAILRYKDAIKLITDGHPNKHGYLNNLASSFLARFKCLADLDDLEQAIMMHTAAAELSPDDHPNNPIYLDNLACCFKTRFEHLGDLGDLERAISTHKHAIQLTPQAHPDMPGYLNNLGLCFRNRFEFLGELGDLDQAISRHRCAVELTPDGHPRKPACLNNLALSLNTRFEHTGELSDLEQAITTHEEASDLSPEGHPNKPSCLNNLALSLLARLRNLGQPSDLEWAISAQTRAEELVPDDHPDKPGYLSNLANSFVICFKYHGKVTDLEQAISRYRYALELTPDGHPEKPSRLNHLAFCLKIHFEKFNERSDLEQAMELYSHAARSSTGSTTTRFHASLEWISCARALGHPSLLHAYSTSIDHLPQLAWIGLSLAHRYRELVRGVNVTREAAAAALDAGHPETAVEWLEQGRSIVWGELFQLRSSYEELSSVRPDYAHRLRQLSAALERASTAREKSLSSLSEGSPGMVYHLAESLAPEADRHRAIAIERDKLLREIRALPGFERFPRHKEFSQLRASAHSGPIVILNATDNRCDSLIVLAHSEGVIHVPLPGFTHKQCGVLQKIMHNLLGDNRVVSEDASDRVGMQPRPVNVNWEFVLSSLWKGVVKPVLNALSLSTPGSLSRIFWCPTGPFTFFPIHAAGLYGTQFSDPGHKASDFVISSYVPTLSILTTPPRIEDNNPIHDFRLLAVPQPRSDGKIPLPGVHLEMEHIKEIIRDSPSTKTTLMVPSVGTVEEVLVQMKEAHWVHFACHGVQDNKNPTESGICLADRHRLKLSDIITLSRPRGGLAFLSACQTATGDRELSDEAIHIAAGMLFAGYGGVIGTMWSIADRIAPRVARDVYERLFQNGETPDYREAAQALHEAVRQLREGNASFVEWLPFIHVGL